MKVQSATFLRYPGGKQRMLRHLLFYLPSQTSIKGRYIEPFVGGGAVFFAVQPQKAILSDVNVELIELYRGIQDNPEEVWHLFQTFPSTKEAYYEIRDASIAELNLVERSASGSRRN